MISLHIGNGALQNGTDHMDVLVTGADQRQGLAVIRALGSAGLRVVATSSKAGCLGFRSRYCRASYVTPSSTADRAAFLDALLKIARKHAVNVIFPVIESDIVAINAERGQFFNFTLAMASEDSLSICLDKHKTAEIAKAEGILTPPSCLPANVEDAIAFGEREGYPLVIKRAAPRGLYDKDTTFSLKVAHAKSKQELLSVLKGDGPSDALPLLQKFIPGSGFCHCFFVDRNGDIQGLYQYLQDRENPLTGGVSTVHLSMPVDEKIKEQTIRLIRRLDYRGVGQVEYRADPQSGETYLLEVNPRVWAPLSASSKLGLNFALAWYQDLLGEDQHILQCTPENGQRCRYLRGDLEALESYLRKQTIDGLQKLPTRKEALLNVLRDFRPSVHEDVWDMRDPLPGLLEFSMLGGRTLKRIVRWTGKLNCKF